MAADPVEPTTYERSSGDGFADALVAELPRLVRLATRLVRDEPLRCWRVRRHVSAYLDGELDAGTRSAVEAHLESCPTCPPLYAGLVGVKASLGGLRDPDTVVEAAIAGRIREHLDDQPDPSRS